MKPSPRPGLHKSATYNLWVGIFVVFVCILTAAFYYATQKIEYNWRWNRVPIYFAYEAEIDIQSDIDGEVDAIKITGDTAAITVKGSSAYNFKSFPPEPPTLRSTFHSV